MVREAGLEPARPEWTLEPESSESANSTTRAYVAQRLNNISQAFPLVNHFFHFYTGFFFKKDFPPKRRNPLRVKRDFHNEGIPDETASSGIPRLYIENQV